MHHRAGYAHSMALMFLIVSVLMSIAFLAMMFTMRGDYLALIGEHPDGEAVELPDNYTKNTKDQDTEANELQSEIDSFSEQRNKLQKDILLADLKLAKNNVVPGVDLDNRLGNGAKSDWLSTSVDGVD